jgi:ribosomal protein L24
MPRLDDQIPVTKGAAQGRLAKALRAYFEEEQVEVVDVRVRAIDVDVTVWIENHGEDTTFNVRLPNEDEEGTCALIVERKYGD